MSWAMHLLHTELWKYTELYWNMSMHRLTYPLGQRLLQMQFLVAEATFAYSTCQGSIENWVMWFLSAHHLRLLSASGGDLMLSAAAEGCSNFAQEKRYSGQEKDTLLRKSWPPQKERQSQILAQEEETDLPHRLRNSSCSWHHHGEHQRAQQPLFSSTLCLYQAIPQSEVPTSVLGGFNFPSPASIRQCFPVGSSTRGPGCQLQWSWPLLAGGNPVFHACLPRLAQQSHQVSPEGFEDLPGMALPAANVMPLTSLCKVWSSNGLAALPLQGGPSN